MIKYYLYYFIYFFLRIFHIFPIDKNKIFFSCHDGKQFSCNPKYIFLDMYKKRPDLKYIWCLNKGNKYIPKNIKKIKTVKFLSLRWIYHNLTSNVVIINKAILLFMPYRKKQTIINTWHGGGAYKIVGISNKSEKTGKYYSRNLFKKLFIRSNKFIKYFLSSNRKFTEVMQDSFCIPYENFLNSGMPRNDIFFKNNSALTAEIKNNFNIPENTGIVLYAPTHRDGYNPSLNAMLKHINNLDINLTLNSLKSKFNKNFVMFFRGHYCFTGKNIECSSTINVSSYDDMQELLLISDILITDYSSCIWDFSFTNKPCFLFATDIDQYISFDRGFYTPIEQWPFSLSKNNEELCENILNFNQSVYEANIKKHHEDLGSYENGTATEKISELLLNILK